MKGAATPMVAYEGRRPMQNVATPIVISETSSIDLRPSRSPKWPKSTAPMMRARYAEAKVRNDKIVPTAGLSSGKKTLSKTSADAVAKRNRSYHSTVVPITLANAIFLILARSRRPERTSGAPSV